jgi:ABC-2 type transport system ATP-binding protein
MDEPAANLDPEARKIFFELLAERLGRHDDDDLQPPPRRGRALVNRVVEMDMGKVVLDDRVADDVSLSGVLDCRIRVKRAEPAFAKAMRRLEFPRPPPTAWSGAAKWPAPTACASSA